MIEAYTSPLLFFYEFIGYRNQFPIIKIWFQIFYC